MENYTHHFEFRTNIMHFMAAIDGAVVKRYDQSGAVGQEIKVNYVYAPKTAVLKDMVDKSNTIRFPIVAVSLKGFKRASDRVKNKIGGYYKNTNISDLNYTKMRSPVPVDISLELHAMATYQSDLEQIITNWVSYFDPYIVISWKEPYTGYELRSKIIWEGSGNITYPDPQDATKPYRLELTAGFTFEGWLFKAEPEEIDKICCIDTSWHILSSQFCVMGDMIPFEEEKEEFHIQGLPIISGVSPLVLTSGKSWDIDLKGNFINIKSVLVSANNVGMFEMSAFDYFPNDADYPHFNAFPIEQFAEYNGNLAFSVEPMTSGNFDIIVVNECGYAKLTDSEAVNPYDGNHPYHNYWDIAFESGITVLDTYPLSCR